MPSFVSNSDSPFSAYHFGVDPSAGAAPQRRVVGIGASTWYAKRLRLRRLWSTRTHARLLAASTLVTAHRRALLLDPSGSGDTVWWIEEGRARLSRFRPDGREVATAVLEEGELFGQEPRVPFAIADVYVEVIESGDFRSVGRAFFERLLQDEVDASHAIAAQLAHQHGMTNPPSWFGERPARARGTRLTAVLSAFHSYGADTELPAMSLQEYALISGIERPDLVEALAGLVDAKVCSVESGVLRVLDAAALVRRSESR
jgi:CRP-like cAMP-binding protein